MSSDTVKFFTGILYFFSECNFHLFLCWSSSGTLLSSDWILGPALSYAVCTYETRHWAQPFPMQFEHMGSIGPHIYISLSQSLLKRFQFLVFFFLHLCFRLMRFFFNYLKLYFGLMNLYKTDYSLSSFFLFFLATLLYIDELL